MTKTHDDTYIDRNREAFDNWLEENKGALDLDAAEICVCEQAFLDARESCQKEIDNAYWERNRLVAILARLFPSGRAVTNISGWDNKWHNCIYIDTPRGQLSWHVHDDEMIQFASLPEYPGDWDGHTTEEKYRRTLLLLLDLDKTHDDAVERIARAIIDKAQETNGTQDYTRLNPQRGESDWDVAVMLARAAIAAYDSPLEKENQVLRDALEVITDGDESKIWESHPDVTYDEAVMAYAKQALEEADKIRGR